MSALSSVRARWIAWRNERLKSPEFQRFCADTPMLRGIARAHARRLFDLVAGFVYSQTLLALVQIDALAALSGGPRRIEELATASGLPQPGLERLLNAAAALKLVEPLGDGRYALGADGAALLGQPGLTEMIRHHVGLYADLADPAALLREARGAALSGYWPYAGAAAPVETSAAQAAGYSALMAATQPAVAAEILRAYPMRRHREVLDVGGGEGAFLEAVGARWPHLRLRLFDLPAVVARAQARLACFGPRAAADSGDFLSGVLPAGADLITLVRVLHDQDADGALLLLTAARRAVASGGRLLIAEPMSAAPRPDPVSDAYFGLYFMAMGRGEARTPARINELLRAAGWRRPRMLQTRMPELLRIIVAQV